MERIEEIVSAHKKQIMANVYKIQHRIETMSEKSHDLNEGKVKEVATFNQDFDEIKKRRRLGWDAWSAWDKF